MSRLPVLFLLLACCLCHAAPTVQDPAIRPARCLNGEWQFQSAADALPLPAADAWDPVPIRIPSPWNVNSFSRGDGGDFLTFPSYPQSWEKARAAWHRREFTVPDAMRDKALFLRFEAVSFRAEVYVNGKLAGTNEDGFLPFELDITDLVRFDAPNQLLVGVQGHHLFNVKGRATYGWGSFWGGHIHGIWQDVWLLARPKVCISDAFVMTSVEDRTITLQITLDNRSSQPARLRLNNHVFPADKPAPGSVPEKGFERIWVEVDPGETRTVTLTEPWASPRLWWPHDPRLYMLVTRIYPTDEAGEPLDMLRTRFGFREFRIGPDGRKFQLNGVTWSGRGDAWHFMGIPQLTPDYARAWYEMAKSCNINIIRLHAQVYPEYYLDVADEMGMLIVDETALWGSAINFWYNEDFLRRASDHAERLVLRDRNHPSVVLWSVANEIYARKADDNAPSLDWIFARYAEWAQQMRDLDPTREVSSDGDNDLNGRLNVYSYHYPGAGDPKPGKITTIGEAGSMYYSTPPEVAHAIGDRAYRTSNDRMQAVAIETADLIEGYRKWAAYSTPFNIAWYGLEPLPLDVEFQYEDLSAPGVKPERLGPYTTMLNAGRDPKLPDFRPNPLYVAVKDAFEPIRFFLKERNPAIRAGQETVRHLTVHNDTLEPAGLSLAWQFSVNEKPVARRTERLRLAPGEMSEVSITLPVPDCDQAAHAVLELRLSRGGMTCYQQRVQYTVLPAGWPGSGSDLWGLFGVGLPEPGDLGVALYDPSGKTAALLTSLGVEHTRYTAVDELLAALPDLHAERFGPPLLVVVGAGSGIAPADAARMDDAALLLVVLENNPGFYGDHSYCTRQGGTYRRGFAAPWLATDSEGDAALSFWGEDGVIARAACGREVHGNVIPLVTCGDGDLAMFAALRDRRVRVFSELALVEKAEQEPSAAALLKMALFLPMSPQLSSGHPIVGSTRIQASERSRFATAAEVLGVEGTDRPPKVLLCDGSAPPVDPDLIRAGLAGDTYMQVLLCNLRPETLEAWNAVLPVKLALEPCPAVQLIRADDGAELLCGVNHRDLFWIEENNTRQLMDWAVSCERPGAEPLLVTNHTDWRRWCWQGENIKTGAIIRSEREPFTEQTGLLRVPRGESELLVSQVRLDPTNPKSMRYYSQLLTNLGVPLRRGKATSVDMTAFNMDADGFILAWLLCGPFGKSQPALPVDTSGFAPEPGLLTSGRIWGAHRSAGPVLDFTRPEVFGELHDVAVYAATWVRAESDTTAQLWLGSDDGVTAWLNGQQVHRNPAVRPVAADSDRIPGLSLKAGWNLLVLRIDQGGGEWGMCARLVDDTGRALEHVGISHEGPARRRAELPREAWKASASPSGDSVRNAFDGDPATRWSTGEPQRADMQFTLDMGAPQTVSQIVLDSESSPGDYPRGLRVEASTDGATWRTVAECSDCTSAQAGGVLRLIFDPVSVKMLRFTQTGPAGCAGGLWWSIHELRLLE